MLLGPRPGHVHQLLWAVIWGPGMRPRLPAPSHVLAPDWDFLALLKTGSCSWGCLEKREALFPLLLGLRGEKSRDWCRIEIWPQSLLPSTPSAPGSLL